MSSTIHIVSHTPIRSAQLTTDEIMMLSQDTLSGWNVLLWNDEVHSMDYVVAVLVKIIGLTIEPAVNIMLQAHETGKAVAYTGAKEIAEAHRDGLEQYGLTATLSR